MLRIKNLELIISKTKIVTITVYSVIIKSVIVENDSRTFFIRELTFRQVITFTKTTPFIKKPSSFKIIIFVKSSTFIFSARETSFIEISRIAIMNEYRSSHINIKNVIAFASLKMKKVYNARYQLIFFEVKDLINLRLYKDYKISVITSKKIEL